MAVTDLPPIIPVSVSVSFPQIGSSGANAARLVNQFAPAPYIVNVTLASLGLPDFLGVTTNPSVRLQKSSAIAAYNEAGTLTNAAELTALARQIATDYYRWQLAKLDMVYAGVAPWAMTGMEDHVEWTHSEGKCQTRIQRSEWNGSGDMAHLGTPYAANRGSSLNEWEYGEFHQLLEVQNLYVRNNLYGVQIPLVVRAYICFLDYEASGNTLTITGTDLDAYSDGVSLQLYDRFLFNDGTASGGIYYISGYTTILGTDYVLATRTTDFDFSQKVKSGAQVVVTEGDWFASTTWELNTPDPIVLNTTLMAFILIGDERRYAMITSVDSSGALYDWIEVKPFASGTFLQLVDGWSGTAAENPLREVNGARFLPPGTVGVLERGYYDCQGGHDFYLTHCCEPVGSGGGPHPPPPPGTPGSPPTYNPLCAGFVTSTALLAFHGIGSCTCASLFQIAITDASFDGSGEGTWDGSVTMCTATATAQLIGTVEDGYALSLDCGGAAALAIGTVQSCSPLVIDFAFASGITGCCTDPFTVTLIEGLSTSTSGSYGTTSLCQACAAFVEQWTITFSGFVDNGCATLECPNFNGTFTLDFTSDASFTCIWSSTATYLTCGSSVLVPIWRLVISYDIDRIISQVQITNDEGYLWTAVDFNCLTGATTWVRGDLTDVCSGGGDPVIGALIPGSVPPTPSPDGLPHPLPGGVQSAGNLTCCATTPVPPILYVTLQEVSWIGPPIDNRVIALLWHPDLGYWRGFIGQVSRSGPDFQMVAVLSCVAGNWQLEIGASGGGFGVPITDPRLATSAACGPPFMATFPNFTLIEFGGPGGTLGGTFAAEITAGI